VHAIFKEICCILETECLNSVHYKGAISVLKSMIISCLTFMSEPSYSYFLVYPDIIFQQHLSSFLYVKGPMQLSKLLHDYKWSTGPVGFWLVFLLAFNRVRNK